MTITALSAAALFVIADFLRTLEDNGNEFHLVAQAFIAEVIPIAEASLAPSPAGTSVSPALPALDPEALAGVWQRGAAAFAAAFVAIGLAYRRREDETGDERPLSYEDLLQTIPYGVACWDGFGNLRACNRRYEDHLGLGRLAAIPGVSYNQTVTRLTQKGSLSIVSDDDKSRVLEVTRENGTCLLVEEHPLTVGGFVTLVSDITERRQAELLLESAQEERRTLARRYHEEKLKAEAASLSKSFFLAHLSHDIRTPLNAIIGFAEFMQHQNYGPLGDPRYLDYVETIKGSGQRLLAFFASILDLAQLENGEKELRQDVFPADELIEAAAQRYRSRAARAGIGLVVGAPTEAMLRGDRFCLERMLGNLLDNAIRFTPAGGRITLAGYAASDGIVLEVTDTGIGMGPQQLDTLSQPFAFTDASLSREHSGTGLGVAIARAIAEQSGGRLAIDSRPGLGTTVAVSLPILPAVQHEVAA